METGYDIMQRKQREHAERIGGTPEQRERLGNCVSAAKLATNHAEAFRCAKLAEAAADEIGTMEARKEAVKALVAAHKLLDRGR